MSDAYIKILKPLIGGKITKIIVDPTQYGDTYMGLIVEKGKQTFEVVGLADPEGNGAGFLSVTKISDFSKKPVESAATN
jgi:hypothetical protein